MKKNTLLLLGFSLLILSCNTRKKIVTEINSQIDSINYSVVAVTPESKSAERLIANINEFVSKYPADSLSPKYLLEAGLLFQKQTKYKEAIAMFNRLQQEYPGAKQSSTALFMEGFIYNNLLQDYAAAKQKYEQYLQKYSSVNPQFTHDVEMELKNIGKSPEELFKELQSNTQEEK